MRRSLLFLFVCWLCSSAAFAAERVVYEGVSGPGLGKHIVFLAGDEEYRSEEGLPKMAKILAVRGQVLSGMSATNAPVAGERNSLISTAGPPKALLRKNELKF
jgi:hypothetical protein